jgi:hypothetical protein
MPRGRAHFIGLKTLAVGGLSAMVATLGGVQSAAYAEKGWELTQYSDYLGPEKVLVSKSAIKVTAEKYGVSLMSSAPKFQVLGVNDRTRCYYLANYDEWAGRFEKQAAEVTHSPSQEDGSEMIAGVRTIRYLVKASHAGSSKAGTGGFQHNTVLCIYPEIKTAPKFIVLLATIAYVPSNLGFPLKVLRHRRGIGHETAGDDSVIWDTRSIKPAEVPVTFEIPKGYTRVDTEMALFIGGGVTATADGEPGADALSKTIGKDDTRLWVPGDGIKNDDLFGIASGGGEALTIDGVYDRVRQGKSLRGAHPVLSKDTNDRAESGRTATVDDLQQHAGQWAPGL